MNGSYLKYLKNNIGIVFGDLKKGKNFKMLLFMFLKAYQI